jgi:hypothetical protein
MYSLCTYQHGKAYLAAKGNKISACEGLFRLKIAWAILYVAAWLLLVYSLSLLPNGYPTRALIGTPVAGIALAVLPFVTVGVDIRLCLGIVAVWGALSFAEGAGKWHERALHIQCSKRKKLIFYSRMISNNHARR